MSNHFIADDSAIEKARLARMEEDGHPRISAGAFFWALLASLVMWAMIIAAGVVLVGALA
jgi:hypothetical protein